MDWNNPTHVSAFFELHSDNPREGPGDRASTARAMEIVRASGCEPERILDLACGPGLQTRHLAALAPLSHITALDLHEPFVAEVNQWVTQDGLAAQITAQVGDMTRPAVAAGSMDLVWCEGALYMLGLAAALRLWQPLLRSGGVIAFTEPVFLPVEGKARPAEVIENWQEYPAMSDVPGVRERVAAAGFEVLGDFVLPAAAWAAYYDPLQIRVDALRVKYIDDTERSLVVAEGQAEIDAWRNFGEHFSYAFFVVREGAQ